MRRYFLHNQVVKQYEDRLAKIQQNIGVCAILINPQGKILMGKRKNGYKPGFYGLPGGRIGFNEPIAQALKREILEETCLKLSKIDFVGVVRENQDDNHFDFIHFVFMAQVDRQPQTGEFDKCEVWEWIDINKPKTPFLPGHRAALKMYLQKETLIDVVS